MNIIKILGYIGYYMYFCDSLKSKTKIQQFNQYAENRED